MARVFSEELIKRFKAVFEKRAKRKISDEETEIYLHQLAKLGLIAHKVYSLKQEKQRDRNKKKIC